MLVKINIRGINISRLPIEVLDNGSCFSYRDYGASFNLLQLANVDRVISILCEHLNATSNVHDHLIEIERRRADLPERHDIRPRTVEQMRIAAELEEEEVEEEEGEYEFEDEDGDENPNRNTAPIHVINSYRNTPVGQSVREGQDIMRVPVEEPYETTNFDRAFTAVAAAINEELGSKSHEIEEKRIAFEKEWSRLILKKRELDRLTTEIQSDSVIQKINAQVDRLMANDNLVDSVVFSRDKIIVKTKELSTDNEIDGHRRLIGRMKIIVDMKALAKGMDIGDMIKILNLDRVCVAGEIWQCGHIHRGGACFGTALEPIFNSIVNQDIESLVEVCIRFICNPSPRDSYCRHLIHWPITN